NSTPTKGTDKSKYNPSRHTPRGEKGQRRGSGKEGKLRRRKNGGGWLFLLTRKKEVPVLAADFPSRGQLIPDLSAVEQQIGNVESPVSTPAPPPLHPLVSGSGSDISSPCEQLMVRTRSVAVNTADAALATEPECLGPCEPGTSVNLEGIVWQETEDGMLVVNVTWRNKTYVGTLLDCTRHDWAPPRFCESPSSDVEMRGGRGRGKRIRPGSNTPLNDNSNSSDNKGSGSKEKQTRVRHGTDVQLRGHKGLETNEDRLHRERSPTSWREAGFPSSSNVGLPLPRPHRLPSPPTATRSTKHMNGLKYHQARAHNDHEVSWTWTANEASNDGLDDRKSRKTTGGGKPDKATQKGVKTRTSFRRLPFPFLRLTEHFPRLLCGKGGGNREEDSPDSLLNGSEHQNRLASIKAEADKPLARPGGRGGNLNGAETGSPAYSDISDAGEDGEARTGEVKVKTEPDQPPGKEYYPNYDSYYSPNVPNASPAAPPLMEGVQVKKEEESEVEPLEDRKLDPQQPSVIQPRSNMYAQQLLLQPVLRAPLLLPPPTRTTTPTCCLQPRVPTAARQQEGLAAPPHALQSPQPLRPGGAARGAPSQRSKRAEGAKGAEGA
ncbi:hypothetical protein KUCAC02_036612, partial [Chaenocephalus aceratus]